MDKRGDVANTYTLDVAIGMIIENQCKSMELLLVLNLEWSCSGLLRDVLPVWPALPKGWKKIACHPRIPIRNPTDALTTHVDVLMCRSCMPSAPTVMMIRMLSKKQKNMVALTVVQHASDRSSAARDSAQSSHGRTP